MKAKLDQSTERLGLLANGTSPRWDVAVDESIGRDEWSMEIEGPQTYLVFQVPDLMTVSKALSFLRTGLLRGAPDSGHKPPAGAVELHLGRFGPASVSLMWDNEGFPRCFLIIGPKARSTLRLSLEMEDIQMLIEALDQVVKDIAGDGREQRGSDHRVSR